MKKSEKYLDPSESIAIYEKDDSRYRIISAVSDILSAMMVLGRGDGSFLAVPFSFIKPYKDVVPDFKNLDILKSGKIIKFGRNYAVYSRKLLEDYENSLKGDDE